MSGSSLVPVSPRSALTKAGRENNRAIARIEQRAIERAAQVRAVGLVTQVGLNQVSSLTNLEGELIKQVPLAEARLQTVADTATNVIATLISNMAWS